MSKCIPVSSSACLEIKNFGLRFSKELEALSGQRIRGRRLYNALVQPIGYESHAQMVNRSKRVEDGTPFDYPWYLKQLKLKLRNHLPLLLDSSTVTEAISKAEDPGSLLFKVDASNVRQDEIELFIANNLYKEFLSEVRELVLRNKMTIRFSEILQSRSKIVRENCAEAITVTFDYSQWRNETDPFRELPTFNSFLRMLIDYPTTLGGIDIEVRKIKQDHTVDKLVLIETTGRELWERELPAIPYHSDGIFIREIDVLEDYEKVTTGIDNLKENNNQNPDSSGDCSNAPHRIQQRINMLLDERGQSLGDLLPKLEDTPEVQKKLKILMELEINTITSDEFWLVAKYFHASGTWIETGEM